MVNTVNRRVTGGSLSQATVAGTDPWDGSRPGGAVALCGRGATPVVPARLPASTLLEYV